MDILYTYTICINVPSPYVLLAIDGHAPLLLPPHGILLLRIRQVNLVKFYKYIWENFRGYFRVINWKLELLVFVLNFQVLC